MESTTRSSAQGPLKSHWMETIKVKMQNQNQTTWFFIATVPLLLLLLAYNITNPSYPLPEKPGIVLVTGTSSGIGHEIVKLLAQKRYHVLAGVRRPESLEAWKDEIKGQDIEQLVQPVKLDVTMKEDIENVYNKVKGYMNEKNVGFSGIVHNAGLGYHAPLENHQMTDIRRMFDVNFFGAIELTQTFLPLIRENKARIIFMSSLAGRITQPKEGIYSASKHAIEALADALRQELYQQQVSVSLVEPGFVRTPILEKILSSEEAVNRTTSAAEVYPRLFTEKYFKIFETGIKGAGSPEIPAQAVLWALIAARPKTRYPVTNFVYVPTWLAIRAKWLLPDRIFDKIVS